MSKVSVIIAAYNVEKYIVDAVNSVVGQTLKDIEILVVDDCSTDKTSSLLQELAKKDERIKVIRHEQNKSAMIARKTGIENATGDYVMFLDGDDMLKPEACELAWTAINEERVDLLQFDTEILAEISEEELDNRDRSFMEYLKSPTQRISTTSPCGLLEFDTALGAINFTVWNKIYRIDLLKMVNEMVPDEYLNFAEDILFSFLVQYRARSYGYLAQKLYTYRFGCGISTRAHVAEKQLAAWAKCAYVYNFLEQLTRQKGTYELCKKTILRVKKQMLSNIASLFLYRILPEQKEDFITEVEKYCSDEDFILAVSNYTYCDVATPEDLAARECLSLKMFRTDKKEVKRVGVYYFRMYNGGVENVISSLSYLWVKQGYEVTIFTDEEPNRDDYPTPEQVKRVTVPAMKERGFEAIEKRIKEFRRAILDSGIDVMVYNAWIHPYLLLDEMIIKSCGVALAVHTHNLFCCDAIAQEGIYAYRNTALGTLYGFADSVITLTDVDTAWWQALGLRAIKTVNPIQLPLTVEGSKLNGNRMLLVCRISFEKQVLDAIKIARMVHEEIPDAELVIVGKGDDVGYVKMIEDYVKDNELQSFVKMVGFDANVLPYYQNADVLLSTSRYEGFGLVLMESKICGLPMVLYELANLDICKENKGMVIVPQGEIRAAADAVVEILRNRDLKARLGKEARESAERICSTDLAALWDSIFAQTLLPKPTPKLLSQRDPLEIAANMAAEYHTRGIHSRLLHSGDANAWHYAEQCRALTEILEGISRSESYRLGLFLTAIPRKIRNFFRRKK